MPIYCPSWRNSASSSAQPEVESKLGVKLKTIPDAVADEIWSLTTAACETAKVSGEDRGELVQELNARLLRRWDNECQSMTDLEKLDWKKELSDGLYLTARRTREPWWCRFLSYDENRHGRYIVMLVGSAVASYLYPEDTILTMYPPENRLGGFSVYFLLAASALICGFAVVATMALGRTKFTHPLVRELAEGLPVVSLSAQMSQILFTFHRQRDDQIIQDHNTLRVLLAVASCCAALLAACAESFPWRKRSRLHPLLIAFSSDSEPESLGTAESNEQSDFTIVAFQVCKVAQMDVGIYRDEVAKEIYGTLVGRSQELSDQASETKSACDQTLVKFGPISEASYSDDWWFRILFYRRHTATRYLAIIGLSMVVVFLQLLTSVSFESGSTGLLPHSVDRWNENILYGGFIAIGIVLAQLTTQRWMWPLKIGFGIFSAGVFVRVCMNAGAVLVNINQHWSERWSEGGIVLFGAVLLVTLACVLSCGACEFLGPISDRNQVLIRRSADQLTGIFARH